MLQGISSSKLELNHAPFTPSSHFISRQHTSVLILSPSQWYTMLLASCFSLKTLNTSTHCTFWPSNLSWWNANQLSSKRVYIAEKENYLVAGLIQMWETQSAKTFHCILQKIQINAGRGLFAKRCLKCVRESQFTSYWSHQEGKMKGKFYFLLI